VFIHTSWDFDKVSPPALAFDQRIHDARNPVDIADRHPYEELVIIVALHVVTTIFRQTFFSSQYQLVRMNQRVRYFKQQLIFTWINRRRLKDFPTTLVDHNLDDPRLLGNGG
jgi:hypothetical protein